MLSHAMSDCLSETTGGSCNECVLAGKAI
ncbi:hypothetical protein CT19431_MP30128 [Cupriavidus taiwanensis]|nr:hypothetical protein CT19431_MP30128 [Cupriavidus taiwanensis]